MTNMNCEHCLAELEDFLYGELSEDRSTEIRSHLAGCTSCSTVRDELEHENEIFTQFYERTALEPGAEMWEAIRERIDAEPIRRTQKSGGLLSGLINSDAFNWLTRPAVLRQVAFAVLLIALSVAATTFFLRRGGETGKDVVRQNGPVVATPSPGIVPTPAPSPSMDVAGMKPPAQQPPVRRAGPPVKQLTEREMLNQQLARAEREYQNAIKMLSLAIAKRKDSFDPELIKQYEGSLALVDNSIAASRRALRERPDDLVAGQFLLAAYAKKVELMQDFAMR